MDDEKLAEQVHELNLYVENKNPKNSAEEIKFAGEFVLSKGKDIHPLIKKGYDKLLEEEKKNAKQTDKPELKEVFDMISYGQFIVPLNNEVIRISKEHLRQFDESTTLLEHIAATVYSGNNPPPEAKAVNDMSVFILKRTLSYSSEKTEKVTQQELDELADLAKTYGVMLAVNNVKGGDDSILLKNSAGEVLKEYKMTFEDDNVQLKQQPKPQTPNGGTSL